MARYEHLPIYKSALDLTVHMERVVAGRWVSLCSTRPTVLSNAARAA